MAKEKTIPTEFPVTLDGKTHFVKRGDYIKHASQKASIKHNAEVTKEHIKKFLEGIEEGKKEIVGEDVPKAFTDTFEDTKKDWDAAVAQVELLARQEQEKKEKEESDKKEKAAKEEELFNEVKDESASLADLSKAFETGDNMDRFVPKGKVTDAQLFGAFNASLQLGEFNNWMKGDLIIELENRGHLNVITRMAEAKSVPFQSLYRCAKTAKVVKPDDRKPGVSFTIYCEIALAKYSDKPEDNTKLLNGLLAKAEKGEFNTQTAREAVKKAQGKKPDAIVLPEEDPKKCFLVVDPNAEIGQMAVVHTGFPKDLFAEGAIVIDMKAGKRFAENGFKKAAEARWVCIEAFTPPPQPESTMTKKKGANGAKKKK